MIYTEFMKLRGSLASWLCLAAPALAAIMSAAIAARQPASPYSGLVLNSAALWGYFVLPMSIAVLAALLAHVEHATRTWDHILALPIKRRRLYLTKALVMAVLTLAMTLALAPMAALAGRVLAWLAPDAAPTGQFDWSGAFALLTLQWLASLLMSALQLWVALRFRSFLAPIGLGLAGTFAVVAGMGAPELAWLPWAMPMSVLGLADSNEMLALAIGIGGGIVAALLMINDLAAKEAT